MHLWQHLWRPQMLPQMMWHHSYLWLTFVTPNFANVVCNCGPQSQATKSKTLLWQPTWRHMCHRWCQPQGHSRHMWRHVCCHNRATPSVGCNCSNQCGHTLRDAPRHRHGLQSPEAPPISSACLRCLRWNPHRLHSRHETLLRAPMSTCLLCEAADSQPVSKELPWQRRRLLLSSEFCPHSRPLAIELSQRRGTASHLWLLSVLEIVLTRATVLGVNVFQ